MSELTCGDCKWRDKTSGWCGPTLQVVRAKMPACLPVKELAEAQEVIFKLLTNTMPLLTDEEIDKALALGREEADAFLRSIPTLKGYYR